MLGLGTQVKAHNERRYSVTFDHPGSRLREYVLALRDRQRVVRRGEEPIDEPDGGDPFAPTCVLDCPDTHDGIDVGKVAGLPARDVHAEFWLPHGVPVLANVGALVAHKGQRYLLEALPLVMRAVADVHLVIFGEGELRGALERQAHDLGLDKRALMPGFRDDVLELVKSCDLFVMSSVTEGLGSAVLDAMAMGLAVVGTRAGGIPEAVVHEETGLLVPPAEPGPLASAIVDLLGDEPLRRRYGEAGRARVAERFGVDALVEGTLEVYQRVLAEPGPITETDA